MTSNRTDLAVGPYVYSVTDLDPAGYGLADPLVVKKSMRDASAPWPQWEVWEARFRVVAASAADVAGIVRDAPVAIAWTAPRDATGDMAPSELAGPWRLRFDGQVTDVVLSPHRLGVVAQVTAMDYYTARLPEYAPDDAFPQQTSYARLQALATSAGVTEGWSTFLDNGPTVRAADVATDSLYDRAEALTAQWADESAAWPGLSRPVPNLGNIARDAVYPNAAQGRRLAEFRFSLSPAGVLARFFPATLGDTGNGWGVIVPDDLAPWTIRAGEVEMPADWSQRKGGHPNRLRVLYGADAQNPSVVRVDNGESPYVTLDIVTDLINKADAVEAGALYLPQPRTSEPWEAEAVTWRITPATLPEGYGLPGVGSLVTLAGIRDGWNPLGRHWYSGRLVEIEFTLQDAEPVADLTIRPELPRQMTDTGYSYTVADLPPAVTIDQLDPTDTVDDYRLIRKDTRTP